MIKEFAIEPEVIANQEHFRLLFPDFGVGKGRLIARYPKTWGQDVQTLINRLQTEARLAPVKANAMLSQIYADKHKFLPARRDFDKSKDWLRNAESPRQNGTSRPFDAIIANKNPRNCQAVLGIDDLDKEDPRYKTKVQQKIPRTATHIAGCARLLLAVCEEIQIVDPHFDPNESRFQETVIEILAMRANAPQQLKRFEIHTTKRIPFIRQVQEDHYRRNLEKHLPERTNLRVFFWSRKPGGEKLHPRFLLTEFGGLQFDYGIDEWQDADERTIVSLLDHDLWKTLRTDYSEAGSAFAIEPNAIISIQEKR